MDKTRPVLVLTRDAVRERVANVTVAPIYAKIRGLATEVIVGSGNGLDHASAINLDNVTTIAVTDLGRQVGFLREDQEDALAEAIIAAFDLEIF